MTNFIVGSAILVALILFSLTMVMWARHVWGAAYDKPVRMGAVLERTGVDPVRLVSQRGRAIAAAKGCAACPDEVECEQWLAGRGARPLESFCPNARFFETLKP